MSQLKRIIQVEDDPNDVMLFARAFRKAGMSGELHVLQDGQDLIDYLAGERDYADRARHPLPQLILLDIKLPRRSGFDVLQWLREQSGGRRIPVVMLTSSSQPADVTRAYDLGANGFIVKSIDFDSLVRSLKAVDEFWLRSNITPLLQGPFAAPRESAPVNGERHRESALEQPGQRERMPDRG